VERSDKWRSFKIGLCRMLNPLAAAGLFQAENPLSFLFLRPGNYTGIVSGKVGSTGVALVEFYNAQSHVRQTAFRSARVCGVHEIIFRGSQACKPDPTDALLACWCGRLQARGPESAKMANFRYLSPPRSVEPWRRHRTFGRSPGRVRDRVGAVPLVAASLC